ncbi:ParA family protein [Paenibacillus nanensis]|uniref:ParA family protein n=1 Tax=Paenibacillus nanensis TaxID=393251 RepID=A0A3A1VHY2_9BACL|nr:ParA family protein [Paenibacillus nanensis]RIX60041.1 ParA family protein [Paenibacillus nanensis]
MAITISVSSTIDGSCKTTVACMFAQLLSSSYKVLAIDLSGQCNLTETLINNQTYHTVTSTIWDAFITGDVVPYIVPTTENLDILPGDMWIGSIPASLYIQGNKETEIVIALRDLLNQAKTDYDFVVVDSPSTSAPELFDLSLSISDFAIMTYSPNKLSLINQWINRINHVQTTFNPNLRVGGILRTRFNKIEALHEYYYEEVLRDYPKICWKSVFPNSPRFAFLDHETIRKTEIKSTFEPIYAELMLRLLNSKKGSEIRLK